MSIYKNKFSLQIKWRIFYFMAAVCCMVLLFPFHSYADGTVTGNVNDELVFSKKIYHKHTGTAEKKSGCYTVEKTETTYVEVPCKGVMVYWPELGSTSCSVCGSSYFGDQSARDCWKTQTVEQKKIYYELGCGKTEKSVVGTLHVTQSTSKWTKSLVLTASYKGENILKSSSKPYIWNGGKAGASNTYEVTACGKYSLKLNVNENVQAENAQIVVPVQNIDVVSPYIRSHTQEPLEDFCRDKIIVTIGQVEDLQEDGKEGCGLHEQPYSFDRGTSWTAEPVYAYEENGAYTILVRDKLENQSSYSFSITNIDRTPPQIQLDYDKSVNVKQVKVVILAKDLQTDGSEGCGLHEQPYSFDGGVTWSDNNVSQLNQNKTLQVAVRDKLENITYQQEIIQNIDSYGPKVTYQMSPSFWTKEEVELQLYAKDLNEDGSLGSGLPQKWYSVDNGKTWTDEAIRIINENQTLHILARDVLCNHTKISIPITQIDKEAPKVVLSQEKVKNSKNRKVCLKVQAEDELSGLDLEAYSWDGGNIFCAGTEQEVTKNGTYSVTVRDRAGNVTQASIAVDSIKEENEKPIQPEETIPTPEVSLPKKPQKPKTVVLPKEPEPVAEVTVVSKKSKIEPETEETESEEVTKEENVVILEERIDKPIPQKEKVLKQETKEKNPWIRIVVLGLVLGLGLLLLLCFVKYRLIWVFIYNNKNHKRFVGIKWLHKGEEHFMVNFSRQWLERCITSRFCFYLDPFFVRLHREEEISFLFPEKICITKEIKEKLEFTCL